jgi:hypothetical protein
MNRVTAPSFAVAHDRPGDDEPVSPGRPCTVPGDLLIAHHVVVCVVLQIHGGHEHPILDFRCPDLNRLEQLVILAHFAASFFLLLEEMTGYSYSVSIL